MDILQDYSSIKNEHVKINAILDELSRNNSNFISELDAKNANITLLDDTYEFLQNVSEYARNSIKSHFEQFVTYVLRYIFGEEIEFKLEWNSTAKTTSVDFFISTPYESKGVNLMVDPVFGDGGGREDVVAFALRLAFLSLLNNKETVFLDESFSQVSNIYIPSVSELLHALHEKFGYQFIFITHLRDSSFTESADSLFFVKKLNNSSIIDSVV